MRPGRQGTCGPAPESGVFFSEFQKPIQGSSTRNDSVVGTVQQAILAVRVVRAPRPPGDVRACHPQGDKLLPSGWSVRPGRRTCGPRVLGLGLLISLGRPVQGRSTGSDGCRGSVRPSRLGVCGPAASTSQDGGAPFDCHRPVQGSSAAELGVGACNEQVSAAYGPGRPGHQGTLGLGRVLMKLNCRLGTKQPRKLQNPPDLGLTRA